MKNSKFNLKTMLFIGFLACSTFAEAGDYEKYAARQEVCNASAKAAKMFFRLNKELTREQAFEVINEKFPTQGRLRAISTAMMDVGYTVGSEESAYSIGWARCMDMFEEN